MSDRHDAARRRAEAPARRWPIVLPHAHVRRIIDRSATVLILTRRTSTGRYEIHDALKIRRNQQRLNHGRPDLQESPVAFTIEVTTITPGTLGEIDLITARAAGFRTTAEMRADWIARRRILDFDREVQICTFHIADARYLHELVHRGYTNDPAEAATDELDRPASLYAPEALSEEQLERYATENRERYRAIHADEIAKREARSLANQLREAQTRAAVRGVDITPEVHAIRQQLEQIRNKTGEVAA